jgi:parallel beta-helix repeat protein
MVKVTVYAAITILIVSIMFGAATSNSLLPEAKSCIGVPQDYATIQEAVNAAGAGDTVLVSAGVYYENLIINKYISLVGEDPDSTVVDGNGSDNVFSVLADDVTIINFTIRNGLRGILINGNNCTVSNNTITENDGDYGIYLSGMGVLMNYSSFNEISGNIVTDNGNNVPGWSWGNGIECFHSSQNFVARNMVCNNEVLGIAIGGDCNIVEGNNATGNGADGIGIGGDNNSIIGNVIVANRMAGTRVLNSHNNILKDNYVSKNGNLDIWGQPQEGGISLGWSNDNIIEDNFICSNLYWGIDMRDLNPHNIIRGNTVLNNSLGIYFHYSNDSTVYHNNFINNSRNASVGDAYEDIEVWDNGAEGNYWSNFAGADTNLDGIIDTPYVLDIRNQDNYPLTEPWSETRTHEVNWDETIYNVITCCNFTVAAFSFSQPNKQVSFNATGPANSTATCNVTIPLSLMWGNFSVLIDNTPQPYAIYQNQTHTSIYFTVSFQSTRQIKILSTEVVPENPLLTITLITVMLGTALLFKRKRAYKAKS